MAPGAHIDSAGIRIAYDDLSPDDVADPDPVVLLHGFASNRANNWREQGWYDELLEGGRRVVAIDQRGHGESEKLHEEVAYDLETMAKDVIGVLDHLEIQSADLLGYSMGARVGSELVTNHGDRFDAAVLAGLGSQALNDRLAEDAIAAGLRAEDVSDIDHPAARRFRLFATSIGNDLEALAACISGLDYTTDGSAFADVTVPVLVVVGEADDIAGDPTELAHAFADAESVTIPDGDHLTTVGDPRFKDTVVEFLNRKR